MFEKQKAERDLMEARGLVCIVDWNESLDNVYQFYWSSYTQKVLRYCWNHPGQEQFWFWSTRQEVASNTTQDFPPNVLKRLDALLSGITPPVSNEIYSLSRIRNEHHRSWFRDTPTSEIVHEETLRSAAEREVSYWIYSSKASPENIRQYRIAQFDWVTKEISSVSNLTWISKRNAMQALEKFMQKEYWL